jgi:general secretion pathway protein B
VSYILDALKKSEQERSRGVIPDIKAIHRPAAAEPKKSAQWSIWIMVVLLLNAAGLGYWIYHQNRQTALASLETNSQQAQATSDQTDSDDDPSTMIGRAEGGQKTQQAQNLQQVQKPQQVQQQLEQKLAVLQQEAAKPKTPKPHTASPKPSQPAKQSSKQATPSKAGSDKPNVIFSDKPLDVSATELKNAETADDLAVLSDVQIVPEESTSAAEILDDRIYEISELPESVKRELPDISFAGHVYSSSKSQRSVMLNGRKMREGQEVTKGLVLEEITLEGVVLRSQGYRFKLGALQDWSFR